jgi:hypothetical protein
MTVKELLEFLRSQPEDKEVHIETPDLDGDWTPATKVREDSFFGEPVVVIETRQ